METDLRRPPSSAPEDEVERPLPLSVPRTAARAARVCSIVFMDRPMLFDAWISRSRSRSRSISLIDRLELSRLKATFAGDEPNLVKAEPNAIMPEGCSNELGAGGADASISVSPVFDRLARAGGGGIGILSDFCHRVAWLAPDMEGGRPVSGREACQPENFITYRSRQDPLADEDDLLKEPVGVSLDDAAGEAAIELLPPNPNPGPLNPLCLAE